MKQEQQGKKPSEWFKMLKEPYRSQAIANLADNRPVQDLNTALECQEVWAETPQGFEYWNKIAVSIKAGETTYLEPEQIGNTDKLKPEQMESGKWYFVKIVYDWLLKFDYYYEDGFEPKTFAQRIMSLDDGMDYTSIGSYTGGKIENIRPATNEEVLKYFPDEKFEPIELRPEELVSGEVYTTEDCHGSKWTFSFDRKENSHLHYFKMLFQKGMDKYSNSWLLHVESDKIYHATPEEKALLLGEEQTDWEKKYNELNAKFDALADKYSKLELQQNNKEKVYIHYNSKQEKWVQAESLELALQQSEDNKNIYEAVKIGVKKSVLVNE